MIVVAVVVVVAVVNVVAVVWVVVVVGVVVIVVVGAVGVVPVCVGGVVVVRVVAQGPKVTHFIFISMFCLLTNNWLNIRAVFLYLFWFTEPYKTEKKIGGTFIRLKMTFLSSLGILTIMKRQLSQC
jgi:hypothetical protein